MAYGKGLSGKGGASELIVESIGLCTACPEEKNKEKLVIIAYMAAKQVNFTVIKFPAKKPYAPQDILDAVGQAENVKTVRYTSSGRSRDIYACREAGGKIYDAVCRDSAKNSYQEGFAEITSAGVAFTVNGFSESLLKVNSRISLQVVSSLGNNYAKDSYEYALANAYNACLLGELFSREEFDIETRSGRGIKTEVRYAGTEFLVDDVLFVKPVMRGDGFIEYYLTEEFNLYDGYGVSKQSYKIIYSNRLGGYNLIRL